MSRLPGFWPHTQLNEFTGSTRLRRPLRTRMIVALVALVLGAALGVRGPLTPIAHAEPIVCFDRTVLHSLPVYELPNHWGYFSANLMASYRSSDGSYCGHTWAKTLLHLNPGAPSGKLYAYLYDCTNHLKAQSSGVQTGGGGDPTGKGQDYSVATSRPYLECGWARANFVFYGANHLVDTTSRSVN
jgi:hypothetical protein